MTQKKRNKQFYKEKKLIQLRMENNKIREAMRNQNLVELDEPIHSGYYAEWVLRKDILRRDDASVYQEALDACKGKIWSRNKEFRHKNYKTKKWEKENPKMFDIDKKKYELLSPSAKKFFYEVTDFSRKYWRYGFVNKTYRCTLSYELVVKITKRFITHKVEHDNILYQMEAENKKRMEQVAGDGNPWGGSGYGSFWKRTDNRKEKLDAERKLHEAAKIYKSTGDKNSLDL